MTACFNPFFFVNTDHASGHQSDTRLTQPCSSLKRKRVSRHEELEVGSGWFHITTLNLPFRSMITYDFMY